MAWDVWIERILSKPLISKNLPDRIRQRAENKLGVPVPKGLGSYQARAKARAADVGKVLEIHYHGMIVFCDCGADRLLEFTGVGAINASLTLTVRASSCRSAFNSIAGVPQSHADTDHTSVLEAPCMVNFPMPIVVASPLGPKNRVSAVAGDAIAYRITSWGCLVQFWSGLSCSSCRKRPLSLLNYRI